MKKYFKYLVLLFTAVLLKTNNSAGSHISGGEVFYRCLGGLDYELTVFLYRDLNGTFADSTADLHITSVSCGSNYYSTLPLVELDTLRQGCHNGIIEYEKYVYRTNITLPFHCSDWNFSFNKCCRTATNSNLVNAANAGASFTAFLDNLNVPENNSALFENVPVSYIFQNIQNAVNNASYDPDGDSITVEFTNPLDSTGLPIPFFPAFSVTQPILSNPPVTLDTVSGEILITPTMNGGFYAFSTKVKEYRNGMLIGTTTRDQEVTLLNNGLNMFSMLSGINGTTIYSASVCIGQTLQFNLYSSAANPADSTRVIWSFFPDSSYTLNSNGAAKNESYTFTWTPDSSQVSSVPYLLYIKLDNYNCPFLPVDAHQTYAYKIYVNDCVANDVWPGDANTDLNCDIYDILPIGVAYSTTGTLRPGASLSWTAQPSPPWSQTLASGADYKHIDCNGDGVINDDDTAAVALNFGLSHPNRMAMPGAAVSSADFYLTANPDTTVPNGLVTVAVNLGTSSVPVDSIYGIAFRLNFDPALVNLPTVSFAFVSSWMGNSPGDVINFSKTFLSSGEIYAASVRKNQADTSGNGAIGNFTFQVSDTISASSKLVISLSDVVAIKADQSLLNFNLLPDSVFIYVSGVGINENADRSPDDLTISPNPAKDLIKISSRYQLDKIEIINITGQVISAIKPKTKSATINIEPLNAGIYFAKIYAGGYTVVKKIFITNKSN